MKKYYRDCGTHAEIDIFTIATGTVTMLVSKSDLPFLDSLGSLSLKGNYPIIYDKAKKKEFKVHKLLLPEVSIVDHINRNTLDNRRCNLRAATHSQNMLNSELQSNNSTGIKGVYWNKRLKDWEARIKRNNQVIHLGRTQDFFKACCLRKSAELQYT